MHLIFRDRIFKFGKHFPLFLAYEVFFISICSDIKLYSIIHLIPALCHINIITENNQLVPI